MWIFDSSLINVKPIIFEWETEGSEFYRVARRNYRMKVTLKMNRRLCNCSNRGIIQIQKCVYLIELEFQFKNEYRSCCSQKFTKFCACVYDPLTTRANLYFIKWRFCACFRISDVALFKKNRKMLRAIKDRWERKCSNIKETK